MLLNLKFYPCPQLWLFTNEFGELKSRIKIHRLPWPCFDTFGSDYLGWSWQILIDYRCLNFCDFFDNKFLFCSFIFSLFLSQILYTKIKSLKMTSPTVLVPWLQYSLQSSDWSRAVDSFEGFQQMSVFSDALKKANVKCKIANAKSALCGV